MLCFVIEAVIENQTKKTDMNAEPTINRIVKHISIKLSIVSIPYTCSTVGDFEKEGICLRDEKRTASHRSLNGKLLLLILHSYNILLTGIITNDLIP